MAVFDHLKLVREPETPPRRKKGFRNPIPPEDPAEHARKIRTTLRNSVTWQDNLENQLPGYDDRRIFRFETDGSVDPKVYEAIEGIEFISQEEKTLLILFADEQALSIFEERLNQLSRGETPTRKNLIYALKMASHLTPEERMGPALSIDGFPPEELFYLDVELWPIARFQEMSQAFVRWLNEEKIELIDQVRNQPQLVLFRVKVNRHQAESLLKHRDIRLVDLPGRTGISRQTLQVDRRELPEVIPPDEDAPKLAILDSGVAQNHPLIGPALGEAASFLSNNSNPSDEYGHGTKVAGIAIWGEVEDLIDLEQAQAQVWLLSGRVLDQNGEYDEGLVENQISEAVEYFHTTYGCRVFNLSLGNSNRPYDGKHLRGLAVTLDILTRKYDILFVVSAGNFKGYSNRRFYWREVYPEHFFSDESKIIDPATATHAITVGSLATHEKTFQDARHEPSFEYLPVARTNEPSPFTRTGPTIAAAIKPELLASGGNYAQSRIGLLETRGLGRLTLNYQFTPGTSLFVEDHGTSLAAPHIAHYAARLFGQFPKASQNLIRALLIAHAAIPEEAIQRLEDENLPPPQNRKNLQAVCGYGALLTDSLFKSTDETVVIYTEDSLINDRSHFYEIPVPTEFYDGGIRARRITVSLAYTSVTRTTRIDYHETRMQFRLIEAPDLQTAVDANSSETSDDSISEFGSPNAKTHLATDRKGGTVHSCTWTIKQKNRKRLENRFFVVVTRLDQPWTTNTSEQEPYALVVRVENRGGVPIYLKIKNSLQAKLRARNM